MIGVTLLCVTLSVFGFHVPQNADCKGFYVSLRTLPHSRKVYRSIYVVGAAVDAKGQPSLTMWRMDTLEDKNVIPNLRYSLQLGSYSPPIPFAGE